MCTKQCRNRIVAQARYPTCITCNLAPLCGFKQAGSEQAAVLFGYRLWPSAPHPSETPLMLFGQPCRVLLTVMFKPHGRVQSALVDPG